MFRNFYLSRVVLSLLFHFFFISACLAQQQKDATEVLKKVLLATKNYNSLQYKLEITERINGTLSKQTATTKLTKSPFRIYIHQEYPKKGLEVLYVQGWNGDKAYINPNGFPWFNVSFEPNSSTLRANTHHTVLESGFTYFNGILNHLYIKYKHKVNEMISIEGEETVNNKKCIVLLLKNETNFKVVKYRSETDETIEEYAKKNYVSDHMIKELNTSISDYLENIKGKEINVPNDYASKMMVYVDSETYLPILTKVYDLKGLYEQYNYLFIKVNPEFSKEEFSPNYSEYGF